VVELTTDRQRPAAQTDRVMPKEKLEQTSAHYPTAVEELGKVGIFLILPDIKSR
jgi:hypothetical protein